MFASIGRSGFGRDLSAGLRPPGREWRDGNLFANEFAPTLGCSPPWVGAALAAIGRQGSGHLNGDGVATVLDAILLIEVDQGRLERRSFLL